MKPITLFLSLITVFAITSCQEESFNQERFQGEHEFFITGISQSLDYTFTSGRTEDTPDEIRELYITILDENQNMVYEQWYWNHNYWIYSDSTLENGDIYYYENTIPDTLFIPALPAGNYDILAATTYLNFYGDPVYNPDGTWTEGERIYPRIEAWCVSENPIYVGKSQVALTDETQEVKIEMRNISTRITLSREDDTSDVEGGRLELVFKAINNSHFSFEQDALIGEDFNYDYHIYTWMYDERIKHFYTLPRTLVGVDIGYFHDQYEMYNFSMAVPFDPHIDLATNDAISFSIYLDQLLEGARSGTVLWEDISWNDKGDVSIP